MTDQELKVLELAKTRIGESLEDSHIPILEVLIQELGRRIKHFTNRQDIPEDLHFVWSSMALDMYRIELPNTDFAADSKADVSAITVGDTSISTKANTGSKEVTSSSKKAIDSIVVDYMKDLVHYRKLKW